MLGTKSKRCDGLPWGMPCPALEDGTWPEGCDCQMSLNHPDDDSSIAGALVVCVLAAIGLLILLYTVAYGADNDRPAECLTQSQARARYPDHALYWRTKHRCWYAGQVVRNVTTRDKNARVVRLAPKIKTVREQDYNELDAAADRPTYFDPHGMPAASV